MLKRCPRCDTEKPPENFYRSTISKDGMGWWCIDCSKQYEEQYRLAHREQISIRRKQYRLDHPEIVCQQNQRHKQYRLDHPEIVREQEHKRQQRRNQYRNQYRLDHPELVRRQDHRKYVDSQPYLLRLKIEVLTHYGNGKCACVTCDEARLSCLSLDHINNNGYEERKAGRYGNTLYKKLRKRDYPEGYQTMCMNCNFIKAAEYREQRRLAKDLSGEAGR